MPSKFIDQEDKEILEKVFAKKIYTRVPKSPDSAELKALLAIGIQNSKEYLNRYLAGQKLNILEENRLFGLLQEMQNLLNLKKVPRHIECYDISHLGGKFVYGSMITFMDGIPNKKRYRLFKVQDQNNDVKSHQEVLQRRLERWFTEELKIHNQETLKTYNTWSLPDLIIIDGGLGQLNGCLKIFEKYQALAKQNKFKFNTEICALAKKKEEVFRPQEKNSFLPQGELRFLIQRIRDEAHRFGITQNRKARIRKIRKTEITKIPGIGPKTEQKLLTYFGSQTKLVETLYQNPEPVYELVGEKITKLLLNHWKIG